MTFGGITNLDYTVILCRRLAETRAFYRDVMQFPIEVDQENWVSFRVGAALLALRPRGVWSVCDDGAALPGSAPVQLVAWRRPRSMPAIRNCSRRACRSCAGRPICRTGVTGRCSSKTRRTPSSRSMRNTEAFEPDARPLTPPSLHRRGRAARRRPCRTRAGSSGRAGRRRGASGQARGLRSQGCRWPRRSRGS